MRLGSSHRLGCHLRSSKTVQSVYRIAASIAHAQGWLSTPLAREHICQRCGKALPPLGIEPLSPAPKARPLKGRAIWTLVLSHRYQRADTYPIYPPAQLSFLFSSEFLGSPLRQGCHLRSSKTVQSVQNCSLHSSCSGVAFHTTGKRAHLPEVWEGSASAGD